MVQWHQEDSRILMCIIALYLPTPQAFVITCQGYQGYLRFTGVILHPYHICDKRSKATRLCNIGMLCHRRATQTCLSVNLGATHRSILELGTSGSVLEQPQQKRTSRIDVAP